jgi:2-dehydro-3-deoxygluconokinase
VESLLTVPPSGQLDLLALGAMVVRLDPGVVPFRAATDYRVHVSGGEFNVAANLADCFGLRTGIVTAMVDYPIGELVASRIRAMGVTPYYRRFAHDGVRGPNIGTVFSDRGHGVRPPVVFYNRANEAAALLKPGDVNWDEIFGRGIRWFHSGGIFASLSETTVELIIEGMQAARAAGAVVSFDVNYREKLWQVAGGPGRARRLLGRIVQFVDVLIGNEEDLQKGLGIVGPDVAKASHLDASAFTATIECVVEAYPNVKLVATTLRDVRSAGRHLWSAVAWAGGETLVTPTCELEVLDRIGGGDGFAAGLFYGLITEKPLLDAIRLGWAHGALLTTYPGDTTMATAAEVQAFAEGGSSRVQR